MGGGYGGGSGAWLQHLFSLYGIAVVDGRGRDERRRVLAMRENGLNELLAVVGGLDIVRYPVLKSASVTPNIHHTSYLLVPCFHSHYEMNTNPRWLCRWPKWFAEHLCVARFYARCIRMELAAVIQRDPLAFRRYLIAEEVVARYYLFRI